MYFCFRKSQRFLQKRRTTINCVRWRILSIRFRITFRAIPQYRLYRSDAYNRRQKSIENPTRLTNEKKNRVIIKKKCRRPLFALKPAIKWLRRNTTKRFLDVKCGNFSVFLSGFPLALVSILFSPADQRHERLIIVARIKKRLFRAYIFPVPLLITSKNKNGRVGHSAVENFKYGPSARSIIN